MNSIKKRILFVALDAFSRRNGSARLAWLVSLLPCGITVDLLRHYGARVSDNVGIEPGLVLHRLKLPIANLILGKSVYLGTGVLLDLSARIAISDDAGVGARTQLITHVGDYTYDRSDERERVAPIQIGKAVIVYSNCIIGPGVNIGDYARVGAGSIVLKDVPPYSFVAGVPAKFIRDRRESLGRLSVGRL